MKQPKIRFDGFDAPWREVKIGYVLRKFSTPVKVDPGASYTQIGIRSHGKGIFHKEQVTGKSLGDKRVFWIEPNALVLNIVFAWEQAVAVTTDREKGMVASHRFPMYVAKDNLAEPSFVHLLFLTRKGKALLELASPGGAGRNKTLGQKDFEELKIALPSTPEQRKIATFIAAIDARIGLQEKTLHHLQEYKRTLATQIFSQEIRFKDPSGNDFPDWDEIGFGSLFSFIGNNSLSRSCLVEEGGEVRNIHYGDIHSKFRCLFRIENEKVPFIHPDYVSTKTPEDSFCKVGDLVIADASEDYDDVGKSIEILNLDGEKVLAGLHTYVARPKTDAFVLGFKAHLMRSEEVRVQIKTLATGISVLGISKSNMSKIKLRLPCKAEQEKITKFLSAIDAKVDQAERLLKALKTYKAAILQQMLI